MFQQLTNYLYEHARSLPASHPIRRAYRKGKQYLAGYDPRLALLKRMPRNAVCAEIGVWKGSFSRQILSVTKPKRLHLIDPWDFQPEFGNRMFGGSVAANQNDMDAIYSAIQDEFGRRDNVRIHRGYSAETLEEFDDAVFDWIYIDGNHYYDFVMEDLEMALRKVKSYGFITGDDYTWNPDERFPVKRAVDDFVERHALHEGFQLIGSQYVIDLS